MHVHTDGLLSIPETKDVLNVLGLNSLQASSTRLPAEKQQGTNGFLSVDNALQVCRLAHSDTFISVNRCCQALLL